MKVCMYVCVNLCMYIEFIQLYELVKINTLYANKCALKSYCLHL